LRCSRCGKDISFAGKVCPYCGTDKSKDQLMMVWGMLFAIVGGLLGYAVTRHIGWTLLVGFIGMVAGIILAGVINLQPTKEDASALPEVKVRESEATESVGGRGIQVRCRNCKQLNDETAKFCNKCGAAM
jgi:RNA polymerase subunit RPABC4/transcription elongation factor Spt4